MNTNDKQISRPVVQDRASRSTTQPLGAMRCGDIGRVLAVHGGVGDSDLERNLLEM